MPEVHEQAQAELAEIADYYDDEQEGLGSRFLDEVRLALREIEATPDAGAPWTATGVPRGARRVPIRPFPYFVIYVTAPRLVVVAFAHTRRRPGYWRRRLGSL